LWRDAPVGPDARNQAPLRHEAGRIAVLRGGVDVGDYQAVTNYFPVRFRARTDPRRAIDPDLQGLERVPPRVDLTHGDHPTDRPGARHTIGAGPTRLGAAAPAAEHLLPARCHLTTQPTGRGLDQPPPSGRRAFAATLTVIASKASVPFEGVSWALSRRVGLTAAVRVERRAQLGWGPSEVALGVSDSWAATSRLAGGGRERFGWAAIGQQVRCLNDAVAVLVLGLTAAARRSR